MSIKLSQIGSQSYKAPGETHSSIKTAHNGRGKKLNDVKAEKDEEAMLCSLG